MNYNDDSTPAVCDSCLGSNPYVEMKRLRNGAECKLCTLTFTVFKWNSDKSNLKGTANLKKTVICLTCARAKNCCQSCMLDLTFGVDLQTRDKLLKLARLDDTSTTTTSNINNESDIVTNAKNITSRLYNSRQLNNKFQNEEIKHLIDNGKLKEDLQSNLEKIINVDDEKKKILTLLKGLPLNGNLKYTPSDKSIKTLFMFGIPKSLSVPEIKDYFSKFGDVIIHSRNSFAFVEFTSRANAEKAATSVYKQHLNVNNKNSYNSPCLLIINRNPIRVAWSTSYPPRNYLETELIQIGKIINKQMIKLSKMDKRNGSITKSKIAKK